MKPRLEMYDFARPGELVCVNESVHTTFISPHNHDFYEIIYICSGEGFHLAEGQRTPVTQGDLLMVTDTVTHSFAATSNNLKWRNILFLPEALGVQMEWEQGGLEQIFRAAPFQEIFQFPPAHRNILHLHHKEEDYKLLVAEMMKEYYYAQPGYQQNLIMLLTILLTKIGRNYAQTHLREKNLSAEMLVNIVYSFFKQSSSYEKVNLEELAKRAHMTPKYFSKVFKKRTGQNLSHFIRNIRLEHAADLLVRSNLTVEEVMNYVGYQDSKYFYTVFKETFGMTPAQYRISGHILSKAEEANE